MKGLIRRAEVVGKDHVRFREMHATKGQEAEAWNRRADNGQV
jgi:hypothetical protein|nr:MAG TPA: restriction alleviation protein [Caudoviricetes sp.]